MKIAIIGAGFYGCYLAKKLSNNHEVHLFESKEKMCMAAIVNNQNRHRGCEKAVLLFAFLAYPEV